MLVYLSILPAIAPQHTIRPHIAIPSATKRAVQDGQKAEPLAD